MSVVATTIHIKVKHTNVTVYVYTEPQQTIEVFVAYLAKIMKKNPDDMQLQYQGKVLENAKTMQDYGIEKETGQVFYLVYRKEDGSWESVNIHDPTPRPVDRDKIEAIKAQQTQASIETSTSSTSSSSSSSSSSSNVDQPKDD